MPGIFHDASAGAPRRTSTLPAGVDALIFDADDVLFDATAGRRRLMTLLARMGLHTSYHAFFSIWDRDYLDDVHRGCRRYAEAFCTFLSSVGLSRAQIEEIAAASQIQRRELEAAARPFPGVAGALAKLASQGVELAVLSDSEQPAAELSARLATMGLGRYFRTVITSIELAHIKPDPECYQAVLAALDRPADRAAYVGHDRAALDGAARLGLATVAFNAAPDAPASVQLDRFGDLPALVARSTRCAALN